jgi:hypothetical protein
VIFLIGIDPDRIEKLKVGASILKAYSDQHSAKCKSNAEC